MSLSADPLALSAVFPLPAPATSAALHAWSHGDAPYLAVASGGDASVRIFSQSRCCSPQTATHSPLALLATLTAPVPAPPLSAAAAAPPSLSCLCLAWHPKASVLAVGWGTGAICIYRPPPLESPARVGGEGSTLWLPAPPVARPAPVTALAWGDSAPLSSLETEDERECLLVKGDAAGVLTVIAADLGCPERDMTVGDLRVLRRLRRNSPITHIVFPPTSPHRGGFLFATRAGTLYSVLPPSLATKEGDGTLTVLGRTLSVQDGCCVEVSAPAGGGPPSRVSIEPSHGFLSVVVVSRDTAALAIPLDAETLTPHPLYQPMRTPAHPIAAAAAAAGSAAAAAAGVAVLPTGARPSGVPGLATALTLPAPADTTAVRAGVLVTPLLPAASDAVASVGKRERPTFLQLPLSLTPLNPTEMIAAAVTAVAFHPLNGVLYATATITSQTQDIRQSAFLFRWSFVGSSPLPLPPLPLPAPARSVALRVPAPDTPAGALAGEVSVALASILPAGSPEASAQAPAVAVIAPAPVLFATALASRDDVSTHVSTTTGGVWSVAQGDIGVLTVTYTPPPPHTGVPFSKSTASRTWAWALPPDTLGISAVAIAGDGTVAVATGSHILVASALLSQDHHMHVVGRFPSPARLLAISPHSTEAGEGIVLSYPPPQGTGDVIAVTDYRGQSVAGGTVKLASESEGAPSLLALSSPGAVLGIAVATARGIIKLWRLTSSYVAEEVARVNTRSHARSTGASVAAIWPAPCATGLAYTLSVPWRSPSTTVGGVSSLFRRDARVFVLAPAHGQDGHVTELSLPSATTKDGLWVPENVAWWPSSQSVVAVELARAHGPKEEGGVSPRYVVLLPSPFVAHSHRSVPGNAIMAAIPLPPGRIFATSFSPPYIATRGSTTAGDVSVQVIPELDGMQAASPPTVAAALVYLSAVRKQPGGREREWGRTDNAFSLANDVVEACRAEGSSCGADRVVRAWRWIARVATGDSPAFGSGEMVGRLRPRPKLVRRAMSRAQRHVLLATSGVNGDGLLPPLNCGQALLGDENNSSSDDDESIPDDDGVDTSDLDVVGALADLTLTDSLVSHSSTAAAAAAVAIAPMSARGGREDLPARLLLWTGHPSEAASTADREAPVFAPLLRELGRALSGVPAKKAAGVKESETDPGPAAAAAAASLLSQGRVYAALSLCRHAYATSETAPSDSLPPVRVLHPRLRASCAAVGRRILALSPAGWAEALRQESKGVEEAGLQGRPLLCSCPASQPKDGQETPRCAWCDGENKEDQAVAGAEMLILAGLGSAAVRACLADPRLSPGDTQLPPRWRLLALAAQSAPRAERLHAVGALLRLLHPPTVTHDAAAPRVRVAGEQLLAAESVVSLALSASAPVTAARACLALTLPRRTLTRALAALADGVASARAAPLDARKHVDEGVEECIALARECARALVQERADERATSEDTHEWVFSAARSLARCLLFADAIALYSGYHAKNHGQFPLTDELAAALTPPRQDQSKDEAERRAALLALAGLFSVQGSHQLACKRYTLAGDREKGLRSLIESGEWESVAFYATAAKKRSLLMTAGKYLYQLPWPTPVDSKHSDEGIAEKCISLFRLARAPHDEAAAWAKRVRLLMGVIGGAGVEKAAAEVKEMRRSLQNPHSPQLEPGTDPDAMLITACTRRLELLDRFIAVKSLVSAAAAVGAAENNPVAAATAARDLSEGFRVSLAMCSEAAELEDELADLGKELAFGLTPGHALALAAKAAAGAGDGTGLGRVGVEMKERGIRAEEYLEEDFLRMYPVLSL